MSVTPPPPQGYPPPSPWQQPYPLPAPPPGSGAPGWPVAPPAPAWPPAVALAPSTLPTTPVPYHQVLTGPRARGWRPVVAFLLALVGWLVASVVTSVALILVKLATTGRMPEASAADLVDMSDPAVFAVGNLIIAAFIPTATMSIWAVHRVRPGFVSSVVGRLRWGWLGLCTAALVPLWLASIAVATLLSGEGFALRPEPRWPLLLIIVLLTTPLQSAGEEYLFRGWIMQNVGVWIRQPQIALGVSAVASAVLFALAHGSMDPWIVADLCIFATAAVVLTWRTGGLEAAIAMHAVNNVVGLVWVLGAGGFQDAFIGESTKGSPWQVLQSVVVQGIAVAILLGLAKRRGIARLTSPPSPPVEMPAWGAPGPGMPPPSGPPAGGPWPSPPPAQAPGNPGTSPLGW